jgi:trehalose 6-phosphate phosphatase
MECNKPSASQQLNLAARLWLFLDYDGTLAEFAPAPDYIEVNQELVRLVTDLARRPEIRLAVVTGRSLKAIRELLPVITGVLSAGTYGVDLVDFEGLELSRLDISATRPVLESLKPRMEALIAGRQGFYLEDKGPALALHARFADEQEAELIMNETQQLLRQECDTETFQILESQRFLEICPIQAEKGQTVAYLLDRYPWPGSLPVYIGDDEKDESAFRVINERGGISIHVGPNSKDSLAQCRLASPAAVRDWLRQNLSRLKEGGNDGKHT